VRQNKKRIALIVGPGNYEIADKIAVLQHD
jgi:hypothetical protein